MLKRLIFITLGMLFFGLGVAGVFLPVLPTTPFMLLALWLFSRSSKRLQHYLWHHPRFGVLVRNWKQHGIVPRRAKVLAISVMCISAFSLAWLSMTPWWVLTLTYLIMGTAAVWLVTRPEKAAKFVESNHYHLKESVLD